MGGGQAGVCWASRGFQFLNWELTVISALCPQEVCPAVFCFHAFARLAESQLRGIGGGASPGLWVRVTERERERHVRTLLTIAVNRR